MGDMDSVTSARGPLMPSPRLMPMPLLMLTTDTTAVDTVTDMVSDTAVTTVDTMDTPMLDTDTVTSARGPLMPNPRLMPLLMDTTDTPDTDTDVDTTGVNLSVANPSRIRLWPFRILRLDYPNPNLPSLKLPRTFSTKYFGPLPIATY